ncbi:MAG: hypothetical protein ACR2OZ_14930 [Verrucomicrobiales bacterium]
MRRFLSALVFVLWTACYGHCLAEQHGLVAKEDLHCCGEDGCAGETDGSAPIDEPQDRPCGLCDYFQSDVLSAIQPFSLAAAVFFVVDTIGFGCWNEVLPQELAVGKARAFIDTGQSCWLRVWEYLARTAVPVRGPCLVS